MELTTNQKSPISDEKIVELYFERNERAIVETDVKYKKYLFSIAYNALGDRLDSEECLNDTYLGAWNAMPPTRPNVLKAFLTTIMRRLAIKRYYQKTQKSARDTVCQTHNIAKKNRNNTHSNCGYDDCFLDAKRIKNKYYNDIGKTHLDTGYSNKRRYSALNVR